MRYLLIQGIDDGKFNYMEYNEGLYLTIDVHDNEVVIHGPARVFDISETRYLSVDLVPCVRSLVAAASL